MSDYTKYTKQEMQAYAIAKSIKENQIVIVGTGLPLIGASLAKRAICPSCHPIVESGEKARNIPIFLRFIQPIGLSIARSAPREEGRRRQNGIPTAKWKAKSRPQRGWKMG